jgi:hypothetical protein
MLPCTNPLLIHSGQPVPGQSTNEGFPGDGDINRAALIEAIEAGGEAVSLYPASTSKAVQSS